MEKITWENAETVQHYFSIFGYNEYNSNIYTILMWNDVYHAYFTYYQDGILIYWIFDDRIHWMMPLCSSRYYQDAMEYMMQYSNICHDEFCLVDAVDEFLDQIDKSGFLIEATPGSNDYVYDANDHRYLKGKKMQKRRNHYHYFLKTYENRYEYRPLTSDQFNKVNQFLDEWLQSHEYDESLIQEKYGIQHLMEIYDDSRLTGGCIYIDDKLKAFCLGSYITEDTLQMHVEKVDHTIRGLSVALLHDYLMQEEKAVFVNRENDINLPALRKAKINLHPCNIILKYSLTCRNYQLRKASKEDTKAIYDLWLECFEDETPTSTDFYFNYLYDENDAYCIFYHDILISAMQLVKRTLIVDNEPYHIHFVVGVCTKKEYRFNGLMHEIMNYALSAVQDEPFVILQAYNYDIYKCFGFQESHFLKYYHFVQDKPLQGDFRVPGKQDLKMLYHQYSKEYNAYLYRDDAYYDRYVIMCEAYNWHTIGLYADNRLIAYCTYEKEKQHVNIVETICLDNENLQSLMTYFEGCEIDACISPKLELPYSYELKPNLMVKINDPLYAEKLLTCKNIFHEYV